ncbi:MAG: oxygenase MpaB family protein [Vicinamibacterales bacterium]
MSDAPQSPSDRWSDQALDAARRRGDPPADAVVGQLFATGGIDAVRGLMARLVVDDQIVPETLSAPLRDFLVTTDTTDDRDAPTVAAGERLFAIHGPEIFVVLCCSSLPSSYAARKGVQVLHRTAYLARRPTRRLFETAQMIIDVLSPGGLSPAGRGLRTVQKVRLMHAAVRHLIVHDPAQPWPADDFGVPINQEDMLGTLMTFSWVILRGLAHMGITLDAAEQDAYTATWVHIGRLMGIEPGLLPATVAETTLVTDTIERRQVAPSPEGREMTAALLDMMQRNVPAPLAGIPPSLIREFLPGDVADGLGVPRHPLDEALVDAADHLVRPFERLFDREAGRQVAVRVFAIRLLQGMQAVELGDRRARFTVPDSLADGWSTAPADSEESFWRKLFAWSATRP